MGKVNDLAATSSEAVDFAFGATISYSKSVPSWIGREIDLIRLLGTLCSNTVMLCMYGVITRR